MRATLTLNVSIGTGTDLTVTRQNGAWPTSSRSPAPFLVLSAATALRPGRRGLYAALAYPVGWAAGELAGQAIFLEAVLLGLLWWWGWPTTAWLGSLVVVLAIDRAR